MITLLAPAAIAKPTRILSDADFSSWAREEVAALDSEEPRPTPGPDFIPTPSDLVEAVALLNAGVTDYWPSSWPDLLEVSTVSDWDYQAEAAYEAERICAGPVL